MGIPRSICLITHDRLLEVLHYDPETGRFTWRVSGPHRGIGKTAGCEAPPGYWSVQVDRERYLCHRLAWFYVYGVWPSFEVDHRDLDGLNNRLDNLREATTQQNCANQKIRRSNTTGFAGVCAYKGRFRAQANIAGKRKSLGSFPTAEVAHARYLAAIEASRGEFVPENRSVLVAA